MWLMRRLIGFSLPGMARAERTTTSPGSIDTSRWSSRAMRGKALDLARLRQRAGEDAQVSQLLGHLGGRDHARADERHLPPIEGRQIDHLLDAEHVAGEGAHHDSARRLAEQPVERLADAPLRRRETLHLRVRA